jgi:hypothetical protein
MCTKMQFREQISRKIGRMHSCVHINENVNFKLGDGAYKNLSYIRKLCTEIDY